MLNKMKNFIKSEEGDTNIISILVILAVIIALVFLFKGYAADLLAKIF